MSQESVIVHAIRIGPRYLVRFVYSEPGDDENFVQVAHQAWCELGKSQDAYTWDSLSACEYTASSVVKWSGNTDVFVEPRRVGKGKPR